MADEKKTETKKEDSKSSESKTDSNSTRNALFILISLLIIVFLIGLALLINRGLNNPDNNNKTLGDSGLINSDTNVPNAPPSNNSSTNNSGPSNQPIDTSTIPNDGNTPAATPTPSPEPTPTPSSDGSVGTGASTQSSDTSNSSVLPTGHTEDGYKRSLSTQTEISNAGYWIPTQYVAGDIPATNGKYTVQYGDTLWWIAAGHYGDPFKWTTIEGANYSQIGFLPNGQHALIWPNQVLVIP